MNDGLTEGDVTQVRSSVYIIASFIYCVFTNIYSAVAQQTTLEIFRSSKNKYEHFLTYNKTRNTSFEAC